MNAESRLADLVTALEGAGLNCLVMGGHAVRHYGLNRNTVDFDLHLAPDCWDELPRRLGQIPYFAGKIPAEGPSWRPNPFRRFQIGTLPDGREEWLEFWRGNHLLAPFADLFARREMGPYGGRTLPFLSLPDLIRSKETERESDWQDIERLEEFHDSRLQALAPTSLDALVGAIAAVRSRRGFERLLQQGQLADAAVITRALGSTRSPITQAYLLPFAPDAHLPPVPVPLEPVVVKNVRTEKPGSRRHLILVEAVRRQYKMAAQAADRPDKQAVRASKTP